MSTALYHATMRTNTESIKQSGIIPGHHTNWNDMFTNEAVYLALNPEAAIAYVETADTYDDSPIDVFEIHISDIDTSKVRYDWNNRCEYHTDINSIAYYGAIPAHILHQMSETEINDTPEYDIDDFRDSDIYWRVLDTFYEQVETNKET